MRKGFLLCFILFLALPTWAQNATMVSVVSQRFEGGEMIYRHDNGDIYVISDASGQWWRFSSTQYGQLAENQRTAPGNRISPTNGFGRIWANNSTIRSELGWATNVEIGFEMRFTSTDTGTLYLTRLNGIILEFSLNNTWRTVSSIPNREGASIRYLNLSSSRLARGQTITITWEASGSDFVQLAMTDSANPLSPAALFDSMPLSGRLDWTIPETIAGNITVTLWLINYVQSTSPLCCYDRLTSLSQQVAVYQDANFHLETYAAYQVYENGFMIWREDTGDVRVFIDNGTWQLVPEHSYSFAQYNPYYTAEGCNANFAIVNAFWAVWSSQPDIANSLGCAVNNELGYTLQVNGEASGDFHYSLPGGAEIIISQTQWR